MSLLARRKNGNRPQPVLTDHRMKGSMSDPMLALSGGGLLSPKLCSMLSPKLCRAIGLTVPGPTDKATKTVGSDCHPSETADAGTKAGTRPSRPASPMTQLLFGVGRMGETRRKSSSDVVLEPLKKPSGELLQDAESPPERMGRRPSVGFALDQNTDHCITPYALKYGRHPRTFIFNRLGEMCSPKQKITAELFDRPVIGASGGADQNSQTSSRFSLIERRRQQEEAKSRNVPADNESDEDRQIERQPSSCSLPALPTASREGSPRSNSSGSSPPRSPDGVKERSPSLSVPARLMGS
jgi:hypothetical protein